MFAGRLVSILRENVSLAVTGSVLVAFASKLLVVSGNSPTTAFVILTRTGPFNALFGSLLLLFPVFVLIVTTIGFIELPRTRFWQSLGRSGKVLIAIVMLLPTLLLVPWLWVTIYAVAFLLLAAAKRWGRPATVLPLNPGTLAVGLFVAYAVYGTLLSSSLWLPPERIEFDSGEILVGYELSRDPAHLILLRDRDRRVIRVSHDEIADRSYCRPRSLRAERSLLSLAGLWIRDPDYERCRD